MGWKTIVGGVVGVFAWVLQQDPLSFQVVMQAAGMILGVVGIRHSVAKAGK